MLKRLLLGTTLLLSVGLACAQATGGLPAFNSTPSAGGGTTYSLTIQTLLLMTALTFIPAAVLMMTSFTRIIIVLSLLRHAMGTQSAPPNQVLVGLALFLTFFIMSPTLDKVYTEAYLPLSENKINIMQAGERAAGPIRTFMLKQTREADIAMFANVAKIDKIDKPEDTPLRILIPAFVIRTKNCLPDRLYTFHPLSNYRYGGCQHVDVHGYDDDVTRHGRPPLQAHAVRAG